MLHEESHTVDLDAKIVRMANQIGIFFETKPHEVGVAGVADHINKFWEPRMRRQFFRLVEAGDAGFRPIVLEAALTVRKPPEG